MDSKKGDPVLLVHVCFVRHGETTSNRDRILQGVTGDSPLTERGLKQARSAGEALRTQHAWDIVLSSDLKRARTTAELILDAYKATTESDSSESSGNSQHDIEACELLREINFGVLEGLPRGASVEEGLRVRAERLGMRIEEVRDHREAPHDVEQRHVSLLYLIAARALHAARVKTSAPPTARHVKVLCVSHGGFIRSFVTKRIGVHCESVPNCSFTEVEVGIGASGEVVSLRLLRLNDATHIPADI